MNQQKPIKPDKKRDPVPQKYLERAFKMLDEVWNDEHDGFIVLKDKKAGRSLFIGKVEW